MEGRVKVVGTGPGHEDYLTLAGRRAIEEGEVLIGARRLLEVFARQDQQRIEVDRNLSEVAAQLAHWQQRKKTVVLVSGDTGFYSLADYLVKTLGEAHFDFIPGISSVQLMFARLKRPWQDTQFMSLHGRNEGEILARVAQAPITALLTGAPWTPQRIAEELLARGLGNLQVYLGKDLSYPEEVLVETHLQALAKDKADYSNSVMVIIHE